MSLLEKLKEQTTSLREEFVAKMIAWAEKEYDFITLTSDEELKERLGWKNRSGLYEHTKKSYAIAMKGVSLRRKGEKGKQEFLEKAKQDAITHYQSSLAKLSQRIQCKGFNEELVQVSTARIGANLETVITDGTKTVKAFTVLAWGDIQKPHYRYLVKDLKTPTI
jgi:hypothetical protein